MSVIKYLPYVPFRSTWRRALGRIAALEKRCDALDGAIEVMLSEDEFVCRDETGMNGQLRRKEAVKELFDLFSPEVAIETGTFLGMTTGYIAKTFQVPVHTCEVVPRNFGIAKRVLRSIPNVHLNLIDSRTFLSRLAKDVTVTSRRPFCYLDAHWYEDLPLRDEMKTIASNWETFVIVIDDFEVIDDVGYGFDDYGSGKVLTLEYIKSVLEEFRLAAFYPKATSTEESGFKRGYVVVVPESLSARLEKSATLRRVAL